MAKFRKRSIVVEAEQFTPYRSAGGAWHSNIADVTNFSVADPEPAWMIRTLEGPMYASAGDWIITGVKGERYPCKPDIFAKTYDPVSE